MNYDITVSNLQDKGWRMTKIRKAIIKVFADNPTPLSAGQVEEILNKAKVKADKTTIYREIRFLLENNCIIEVFLFPNEVSYESAELKHHHHLVCEKCGKIEKMTRCVAEELSREIYLKKGFKVERHVLEFYGICKECAQKMAVAGRD